MHRQFQFYNSLLHNDKSYHIKMMFIIQEQVEILFILQK